MGQQRFPCFGTETANLALQFLIGNLTEELRQRHDVLLTVTQWRNCYLEVVQAEEQIFPETLFTDGFQQVLAERECTESLDL